MSALVLAREGEVAEIPKSMIVTSSTVVFNGAVIETRINNQVNKLTGIPLTNESAGINDEEYAAQFLEMLGIKSEFETTDKKTDIENMLSRVLFQCLLSGILGFIYNTYISEFSIYNPKFDEAAAHGFAFNILQSKICTDEQQSEVATPGTTGNTCIMPESFKQKAEFIKKVTEYLTKSNTLTPELKSMLGVPPPIREENIGQNYETLLEMVMRLGTKEPEAPDSPNIRLRILKNVCKKIVTLLTQADIINGNYIKPIYEFAEPIASAVGDVVGQNTTFVSRLKSLIVLAAAYNSYGWLFAIIAPFAVPAAVNVAIGTVKGLYQVVTLPVKLIKYIGTGFGAKKIRVSVNRDPINRLICIGYTNKLLPGDAGILKIPYYINLNNILDLSEELQSYQFLKRSLLSSIFNGHGVFDLADMQCSELPIDQQRLLSVNNPVVTLTNYIDDEIKQLTTFESDEQDDIKVFPELLLRILVNTINDVDGATFAQGPVMQTTIRMWLSLLHEGVSAARSGLITCAKTFIRGAVNSGPDRIFIDTDSSLSRVNSDSSNSSVDSSNSSVSSSSSLVSINSFSTLNSRSSINSVSIDTTNKFMTVRFNDESLPMSRAPSMSSEVSGLSDTSDLSFHTTSSQSSQFNIRFQLPEELREEQGPSAVNLFDPELILLSLEVEAVAVAVAEAKGEARLESRETIDGGYKRKNSNIMPRNAAKMQNKLVSQHRTVNNQKVMQYMPDYDINQRKFVKGRKSKNYRNKKQKTKKRNKNQTKQIKRQTKKVLRKHRTTKKRYKMNK